MRFTAASRCVAPSDTDSARALSAAAMGVVTLGVSAAEAPLFRAAARGAHRIRRDPRERRRDASWGDPGGADALGRRWIAAPSARRLGENTYLSVAIARWDMNGSLAAAPPRVATCIARQHAKAGELGDVPMAQETDVLLAMYQENTAQGRHHEIQRSTMTNLVVAICAGILGLFALDKTPSSINAILAAFLVVLGCFGALFSAKHYERFSMHNQRARGYRAALEAFLPETRLKAIKRSADAQAEKEFPHLFKLRLFRFWVLLHLSVSVVGLVLLVWSCKSVGRLMNGCS
jgi:hypothetical protein